MTTTPCAINVKIAGNQLTIGVMSKEDGVFLGNIVHHTDFNDYDAISGFLEDARGCKTVEDFEVLIERYGQYRENIEDNR